MSFLRTVSTRRLLTLLAGVVLAIAGGAAIAVAAGGGGPVPPHKPLANAIHSALSAPQVKGITARVSFTNHLVDSSDIQGADPILKGATGRLWLAKDRLRLELQSDNGDAQLVVNNGRFWAYDPSRKAVYQGKLPANHLKPEHSRAARKHKQEKVPSVSRIQSELGKASKHLLISGAVPGDIGGHPDYGVRVSPRQHAGLVGGLGLVWDAVRGVPLSFSVYARGDSTPVLELKVSKISYGPVNSSVFSISPPSGAKVTDVASPGSDKHPASARHGKHKAVTGPNAVAKHLSFKLAAPSALAGRNRQEVALVGGKKDAGAIVTYGQGLDGVAVLEQNAKAASHSAPTNSQSDNGDRQGVSLPTVSINGSSAQELKTPLGTLIRFSRGGVTYTVVGSVPASTAEAAARGL